MWKNPTSLTYLLQFHLQFPPLQFHSSIHIIYDDDDDDDDAHVETPNQKFLGPCMVKKKVFKAELQNHICATITQRQNFNIILLLLFFFFFLVFPLLNEDK
jgi:hypothetical protein